MAHPPIPVEVSARHVHLTESDWALLFGSIAPIAARMISQPAQFVGQERITLRGPRGTIERVAFVGPFRTYTQAELAASDARQLGLEPPLSDSGSLSAAATVTIIGPQGSIERPAAIIQQRHLHMSPADAATFNVRDRQTTSVSIDGPRGARLDHVLVRVDANYQLCLHLDTDEGNACGVTPGSVASLHP